MKIGIAQINPIVGDLHHNTQKILAFCKRGGDHKLDLLICPELCLLGYPPKDLLLRNDFLDAQMSFLQQIARQSPVPVLVGAAEVRADGLPFNAAFLCHKGQVTVAARKILLPNYNVFDEKRYFAASDDTAASVLHLLGKNYVVSICEDAWSHVTPMLYHGVHPIDEACIKHERIDGIINMSASPFSITKPVLREQIFTSFAKRMRVPVFVAGQVGANDQLLFDGHSMIIDENGHLIRRATPCTEELLISDEHDQNPSAPYHGNEFLIDMLTMGIRDYVDKCRLPGVILGISGGIDSAVVASLAVRALSPARVKGLYLPSKFSSKQSAKDAAELANNLGITLDTLAVEEQVSSLRELIKNLAKDQSVQQKDIADQNMQARIRGLLIMAVSNLTDFVMLATSNKSELAVGYATIYGDMCGALSPIGDVYKTRVYELAHAINQKTQVIPNAIIERPPTAELKPNQLDADSLPDYPMLDEILYHFIECEQTIDEIARITGARTTLIHDVIAMVNRSEYKRRQGPFCLMISEKVFGDARRLPIAKRVTIA